MRKREIVITKDDNIYRIIKYLSKPIQLLFGLVFIVLFTIKVQAQSGDVIHVHDPSIIKCNNYYYVYSTGTTIAMRRSADLNSWTFIGSVFNSIPAWGSVEVPGVSNIWAPNIFYYKDYYYLYYSLSTFGSNKSCIGLAVNKTLDPYDSTYKWIDKGLVIKSNGNNNYNAIDPQIAQDISGKIWMTFGSFWDGIRLVEIDSVTMKPKQNYTLYSMASQGGGAIEAPHIIYKNGFYYLFVSMGNCCNGVNSTYNIRVGRSQKITGPYKDKNNISMMSKGGSMILSGDDRWKGPGSCAVLLQEHSDKIVYHAYDAENEGIPTLRISNLNWDSNGWPEISNSTSVTSSSSYPYDFSLSQNYPNPFNSTTTINYFIPTEGQVQIKIFNVLGKEVAILLDEEKTEGAYSVIWNGDNAASGFYLCSISFKNQVIKKKMILLK